MNTLGQIVGVIITIVSLIAIDFKIFKGNLFGIFKVFKKKGKSLNFQSFLSQLKVQDIVVEKVFNEPIGPERLKSELIDSVDTLEPYLNELFEKEIRKRKSECSVQGITFDNNGSFSLYRVDVERPEGEDGKRANVYKLIMKDTDYYRFVFPNLSLDNEYYNPQVQEMQLLRDITGLHKNRLSFENIPSLGPYHFKLGTGTILVTKDNYVIASIRSKKQLVARDVNEALLPVHLSTAEGMYRSVKNYSSSDLVDGSPNPFATVYRSLTDELNIEQELVDKSRIKCLGFFMDTSRAQPFFVFYYKSALTKKEVFDCYTDSPQDVHENGAIIALKWEKENLLKIFDNPMLNELAYDKPDCCRQFYETNFHRRLTIASNHARIGYATAIWYEFY